LKGIMARNVFTLRTLLLSYLCVKKSEMFLSSKENQHHRRKTPSTER
jgi:hypothetical protein